MNAATAGKLLPIAFVILAIAAVSGAVCGWTGGSDKTQTARTTPTAQGPTPTPYALVVGNTGGAGLYIPSAAAAGGQLRAWPEGTEMVVVGEDRQVDGKTWKQVRFPDGSVGLAPAEFLVPPTLPTPIAASTQVKPPTPIPVQPTAPPTATSAQPPVSPTPMPVRTPPPASPTPTQVQTQAPVPPTPTAVPAHSPVPPTPTPTSMPVPSPGGSAPISTQPASPTPAPTQPPTPTSAPTQPPTPTPAPTQPPTVTPLSTQPPTPSPSTQTRSTPTPTPTATRPASPSPTPTQPPTPSPAANALSVGNTGGIGVYIRRTPAMADKITAWPDGTRMTVVGTDRQAEGRNWKNVRAPDGTVGWVPAEYLR
ncbi:MAG: hypothetical protein HY331_11070 [Chloroflexi bacterium]|nr:hypothetical protein [Chloroflexota bacterium]